MTLRLDAAKAAPEGYRAVIGLEQYVRDQVEHTLLELIKMRASILNQCAFCVDMHSQDALAAGIDSRKMFAVAAWKEAPFFSEPERAVLALTDEVTVLSQEGVTDSVWEQAAAHFDEKELANILLAIATINVWNRLAIPTRLAPSVSGR